MHTSFYDCVIIGSGLAGLTAALSLPDTMNILVLAKGTCEQSSSWKAQGGVSAATEAEDTWSLHNEDTRQAGAGHCHHKNTSIMTKEATTAMRFLSNCGVRFSPHIHQEGGHQQRRIHHIDGDQTGVGLITALLNSLTPNIEIAFHHTVVELAVNAEGCCIGAHAVSRENQQQTYLSPATIIASGGCADLFAHSSNGGGSIGSGAALALKAGALLTDMEFMQFHPTLLLDHAGQSIGLVSEAVRGEGAVLVDGTGNSFMKEIHAFGDLAPRDVVARAIHHKRGHGEDVFLDISSIRHFAVQFPRIAAMCKAHGYEHSTKLPVSPGAHYMMGGIVATMDGETTVPGLYAIGEAACTGVHGANRLASNSLLEAIVCGQRVAVCISSKESSSSLLHPETTSHMLQIPRQRLSAQHLQVEMTKACGIVRENKGLSMLHSQLKPIAEMALGVDWRRLSVKQVELLHRLVVSERIVAAARLRTESRGGHYRSDYRNPEKHWENKRINHHKSSLWKGDIESADIAAQTHA